MDFVLGHGQVLLDLMNGLRSSFGLYLVSHGVINIFIGVITSFMSLSIARTTPQQPAAASLVIFYFLMTQKALLSLCYSFWRGQKLGDAVASVASCMEDVKVEYRSKEAYKLQLLRER